MKITFYNPVRVWGLAALCLACWASPLRAQWVTQSITLQPGWNSVYVEVEPQPRATDAVFQGIPIESAWTWNERFTTIQYLEDPNDLIPERPEWLHYFPPGAPDAAITNFFILRGATPLLIKLGGAEPVVWNVTGIPTIQEIDWFPDSFNHVGFAIDDAAPPTFAEFFAASPAHADQDMYRLNASGDWERIGNPAGVNMKRGEAYWIFTQGTSNYSGPFTTDASLGKILEFERINTTLDLLIKNTSNSSKSIVIRPLASEDPPSTETPPLAGGVPLSYFDAFPPNNSRQWLDFSSQLTVNLAAGEVTELRLQVRRRDLAPFTPPTGVTEFLYQSLLEISDGAGYRLIYPVSAEGFSGTGLATIAQRSGGVRKLPLAFTSLLSRGSSPPPHPHAGLWVGTVSLNAVSEPANPTDSTVVRPTDSELQFRLIVHVDSTGASRLLQQVFLLFEKGTLKDDPDDPSIPPSQIVDQPGKFRLITDDNLIDSFTGSLLRDGDAIGRRFSTAAFGFTQPVPMAGNFGEISSSLSASVVLGYDDPLNPFKHQFHPDHDNLNLRFETKLGPGKESFTITRTIEMEFTAADPEDLAFVGLGDNLMTGIYRETISGLHKDDVNVSGAFRLFQVALVDRLN